MSGWEEFEVCLDLVIKNGTGEIRRNAIWIANRLGITNNFLMEHEYDAHKDGNFSWRLTWVVVIKEQAIALMRHLKGTINQEYIDWLFCFDGERKEFGEAAKYFIPRR